jgi:SPP1 gp7 family putative phage head morphogenesis protein
VTLAIRLDEKLSPLELRKRVLAAKRSKAKPVTLARPLPPNAIAASYTSFWLALSREMDKAIASVLVDGGVLRNDSSEVRFDAPADGTAPGGDDVGRFIAAIKAKLARIASRSNLVGAIEKIANRVNNYSRAQWVDQLKQSLGIDLTKDATVGPMIAKFTRDQGKLIRSLAGDKLERVRNVLREHSVNQRVEGLARDIQNVSDVTASRAMLIARTEVTSFNANLNAERHQQAGLTEFEWSTSLDERVRPSHAALQGKRFRYDNPPEIPGEGKHLPGAFPNCRCVAVAVVPGFDE